MGHADRNRSARELEIIEQIRSITDRLPGVAVGVDGFGHTTFKVAKKSLVLVGGGHDGDGSLSIKTDPTTQAMLVKRGPYTRTPYIGQHGWVSLWGKDEIDWADVEDLVVDAYRAAAPKKLLKEWEAQS